MKVVVAPKVEVEYETPKDPGINCLGCNYMICVPD